MKKTLSLTVLAAVMATLFAASLFADNRPLQITNNLQTVRSESRSQTIEGAIRDIRRDRNGFVIRLDRRDVVLFAPARTQVRLMSSRRTAQVHQLERGDVIRAVGSVDRRGSFQVERIELIRDVRSRYETLMGVVERVDSRRGVLEIRDARSRRLVSVDIRSIGNDRHSDLRHIRRGSNVIVTGEWSRNVFDAVRVELVRR